MGSKLPFQVIVDGPADSTKLLEGLILPPIMAGTIAKECGSIILIDKSGGRQSSEQVVSVTHLDNDMVKLEGAGWIPLVKESIYGGHHQFCFTWIGENKFELEIFRDGMQFFHCIEPGTASCKSYLKKATDDVLEKVRVHNLLLWDLNECGDRMWQPLTRLFFANGSDIVGVRYDHYQCGISGKVAGGFDGPGWTNLCKAHNVVSGSILKVNNLKNGVFSVDVFNSDGICFEKSTASDSY